MGAGYPNSGPLAWAAMHFIDRAISPALGEEAEETKGQGAWVLFGETVHIDRPSPSATAAYLRLAETSMCRGLQAWLGSLSSPSVFRAGIAHPLGLVLSGWQLFSPVSATQTGL